MGNFKKIITSDSNANNSEIYRRDFERLLKEYPAHVVVEKIYEDYKNKEKECIDLIKNSEVFKPKNKKIKTIGIFYHRMYGGGVQKVISLQIPIYIRMGYKVVLMTEEYDLRKEFYVDSSVKRVVLPISYDNKRAEVLEGALRDNNVDVLIYHTGSYYNTFFDLLLSKILGVSFVIYNHALAVQNIRMLSERFFDMPYIFRLADKVIVISEVDEYFYKNLNCNTAFIYNPIELNINPIENIVDNECIIWIARFDEQKNYDDALKIIERVVETHPNAKLLMIGREYTKGSLDYIRNFIIENKLENNVELHDFALDTSLFYKKARIHLMTSSYESFSLTIAESKSYGIPLVTYDMPYLELLKDKKGYISVSQRDINAAANEICNLLDNDELLKIMSSDARDSIDKFKNFNQEKAWKKIIDDIEKGGVVNSNKDISDSNIFLENLLHFYDIGIKNYRKEITKNKEQINTINKQNKIINKIEIKNETLKTKLGQRQEQNEALKARLDQRQEQNEALKVKLGQYREQNIRNKQKVDEFQSAIELVYKKKIEDFNLMQNHLKNKVVEKENSLIDKNREIGNYKREIEGKNKEIGNYKREIEEKNKEIKRYKSTLDQIKKFSIGRYIRTKILSKIGIGNSKEEYINQKKYYRLIKNKS